MANLLIINNYTINPISITNNKEELEIKKIKEINNYLEDTKCYKI